MHREHKRSYYDREKRVLGTASVVETKELGTVFVCETGPTQDSRTIYLVDTGQTE